VRRVDIESSDETSLLGAALGALLVACPVSGQWLNYKYPPDSGRYGTTLQPDTELLESFCDENDKSIPPAHHASPAGAAQPRDSAVM